MLMLNISRKRVGKGFTYCYANGETIRRQCKQGRSTIEWIESLAIPPSWKKVRISAVKKSKILALGRDAAGKKQYRYNESFVRKRQKQKYNRLISFAESLSAMRKATKSHLESTELDKNKVLACMVRLIEQAYFRPGNDQYTKDNNTYGLTTLRSKHLSYEDGELVFNYVGKSGKEQERHIQDSRLASIVRELDEKPGYRIFKYYENGEKKYIKSKDLNEYITQYMGHEYSAKDFRTWAGTFLAALALDKKPLARCKSDKQKHISEAVKEVAKALGNTPAVARANYIDPRVIARYKNSITLKSVSCGKVFDKLMRKHTELSNEEAGVLCLLSTPA